MPGFNVKALVKSPKRARFDFSHPNYCTCRIGQLTPTLTEFIIPDDEVSMSMEQLVRLAPMPVPTMTELKIRHDFFFVPLRLLYNESDYDNFLNYPSSARLVDKCNLVYTEVCQQRSNFDSPLSGEDPIAIPGSLFDYLGYPVASDLNVNESATFLSALSAFIAEPDGEETFSDLQTLICTDASLKSLPNLVWELPFCYHFIWRDWYRFTGIETPSTGADSTDWEHLSYFNNHILSYFLHYEDGFSVALGTIDTDDWHDFGMDLYVPYHFYTYQLFSFRFAHLAKDGFTSARFGTKPTVLIPIGANGTIPKLREASAWQRVVDAFSIAGTRTIDKIRTIFNVTPTGFADDRVQFLARYQNYIKIGEVITTATTTEAQTGDYAGRGFALDGKYIFKRRFTEYGWLMCITSVMPNVTYTGISRQLMDASLLDTPIPQLAEVGDQSVYGREINFEFAGSSDDDSTSSNQVIGNQFRYYAYKWHPGEVHGSFRMNTMAPWVPTQADPSEWNIIEWTKCFPSHWNKLFNDTSDEYVWGDRFYMKLDFNYYITRCLPKYVNYHL